MSRLKKNIISGFTKQIVAILYGFILPRMILVAYGSKVNGLVNSVTQFLTLISCMDLGISSVVQAALYKPLADQNEQVVSQIMTSAKKFFHRVADLLLIYIGLLSLIYPFAIHNEFDTIYVISIIITLSIGSFAEFYFGIVNTILLNADQKRYIYDWLSVLVYITTTISCFLLIQLNASIQILKLISSLIFLIRPIVLSYYVRTHYNIDFNAQYDQEPIPQKWNGISQHLSAVVVDSTDVIILTLFSTLQSISVYSVYNLVVTGVRSLTLSITQGVSAHFGSIIAKRDNSRLVRSFAKMEWTIHTIVVIVFGCTSVLIVPFVKLYTLGISDVNYIVPAFAVVITLAQWFRCIRLPYNVIILAAGHFKQTQNNYIIAVVINICTSILLVMRYDLVGVALGTVIAFLFQDVWMAYYVSRNIVYWPFRNFLKQTIVDVVVMIPSYCISQIIAFPIDTYLDWILYAVFVLVIWTSFSILINLLAYKELIKTVMTGALRKNGR